MTSNIPKNAKKPNEISEKISDILKWAIPLSEISIKFDKCSEEFIKKFNDLDPQIRQLLNIKIPKLHDQESTNYNSNIDDDDINSY